MLITVVVAVVLTGTGPASAGLESGAGQTRLASVDQDAQALASDQATLSGTGRYLAFTQEQPASQVVVRDQQAQRYPALNLPAGRSVAPRLSASGDRLAYVHTAADGSGPNLYVSEGLLGAAPHSVVVGGTPGNPRYVQGGTCVQAPAGCRPAISADGNTVVMPATLSPVPSQVTLSITGATTFDLGRQADLVDFGQTSPGRPVTLHVRAAAGGISWAAPSLLAGPTSGAFSIGAVTASSCDTQHCQDIAVSFQPQSCSGSYSQRLRLAAVSAPELGELTLTGNSSSAGSCGQQFNGCSQAPSATAATALTAMADNDTNDNGYLFDAGAVPAGGSREVSGRIVNGSDLPATVHVDSSDCGQAATVVPTSPVSGDQPCLIGETLPAHGSCVAQVRFAPRLAGAPYVAGFEVSVLLSGANRFGFSARFTAHSTVDALVALHAGPGGDFGGPTVVGLDGSGLPLAAGEPSVSGDGRYVAFSSPGASTGSLSIRDTRSASTRLLPYARSATLDVRQDVQPVLSNDGNRIAFTSLSGSGPVTDNSQVYVRELSSDRLMAVSASSNGVAQEADADNPALSADGSTVAFVAGVGSTGAQCGCDSVYSRAVPDDLGDSTATVLESVPDGQDGGGNGSADGPAISADGGVTAFSWSRSGSAESGQSPSAQVYSRIDPSNVYVPDGVDLGPILAAASTPPVVIQLINEGPAPVRPGAASTTGAFSVATDGCMGKTLHAGDSCSITVRPASGAPSGQLTGRLLTGWSTGYLPARTGSTSLSALLVRPGDDPGITRPVTVGDAGSALNAGSLSPALSEDGRFVAFVSYGRLGEPSEDSGAGAVFRRDQLSGTTVQVSGDGSSASPPAISGDGRQLAYLSTPLDSSYGEVDSVRLLAGGPSVEKLSGTAAAPRFERVTGCGYYGQLAAQCRPALSRDGRSVVYPATLDSTSRTAADSLSGPQPAADGLLLDFGTADPDVPQLARIEIPEDAAGDPSTGLVTALGAAAFRLQSQATVACSKRAGQRCLQLSLSFDPPSCDASYSALLDIRSPVPAGQSRIFLVGDGDCLGAAPTPAPGPAASPAPTAAARPAAEGCTPPPALAGYPSEYSNSQLTDVGSIELGHPTYVEVDVQAQQTRADSSAGRTVQFTSPDCDSQLIDPSIESPLPPCQQGQHLDWNQSCAAYLEIAPTGVRPYVSSIELVAPDGSGAPQTYRVTASGTENVLVLDRDAMGSGSFLQAGQPAPEVISRTSAGALMDGSQPSISGDGRLLAFTSYDAVGRPADRAGTPQVYLHDTATGATSLASYLPGASKALAPGGADQPSLSAGGTRVAFSTGRDYPPDDSGIRAVRPAADQVGQVYVRDLAAGRSVLVSASRGASPLDPLAAAGDGPSVQPALSADGSSVAFSSTATNLVDAADVVTGQDNVFLRYLAADLATAGAVGATELMSVTGTNTPAAGNSQHPAVSSDGAFTAFDSTAQLADTDRNSWSDIYSREQLAGLAVRPISLDFGSVRTGTVSATPLAVRVSNAGPGPITFGSATAGDGFGVSSNGCAHLQRQQSCSLNLVFAPTAPGPVSGLLTLPSSVGYLSGPVYAISLSGQAVDQPPALHPSLSLSLAVSRPGRVVQLSGSGFPSERTVVLTWQPGLGQVSATSDAHGDLTAELPIFETDVTGPRVATAQLPGLPAVTSTPLLIEPGTVQPPDFAGRG